MSQTFCLVCLEAQEWIWIGQGRAEAMTVFYVGEPETMAKLQRFLNTYQTKDLRFVCHDTTAYLFDDGWKEFEAPEGTRLGNDKTL